VVRLAAEMAGRAPRGAAIEDHCKSAGRAWVQCPWNHSHLQWRRRWSSENDCLQIQIIQISGITEICVYSTHRVGFARYAC